jgi:hypothetical protein
MRAWVIGALCVVSASVAPPLRVHARFLINMNSETPERQRFIDAIERGMFSDTLIARDTLTFGTRIAQVLARRDRSAPKAGCWR